MGPMGKINWLVLLLVCLITNFPPKALRETNSDRSEGLGPSLSCDSYHYTVTDDPNCCDHEGNLLHKKDHITTSNRIGASVIKAFHDKFWKISQNWRGFRWVQF